ncbi:hypothetical protein [Sanguibacter gelidistatuariae]|uniref:hypothetical protein n=1 Tax=Sanguibacter gelidistatuariae TaxID=1814289 RepID=UPI000B80FC29|nr:hypothetical protein [Sanguibacter gelidistatuariae]
MTTAAAVVAAGLFVLRERAARHLLVSSGLAFRAVAGVATAGLCYMLPQVVVLVAGGAFITPLVRRVGLAWRPGSAP